MGSTRTGTRTLALVGVLALAIGVLVAVTTLGGSPQAGASGGGLLGEYFNGENLETFVESRIDPTVDLDFGTGRPLARTDMASDHFSVRWRGTIRTEAATSIRFRVVHDDGARLYFDNALVLDKWNTFATDDSAVLTVAADTEYPIELRMRDYDGAAKISLQWDAAGGTDFVPVPSANLTPKALGGGLLAEYYDGEAFQALVTRRVDPEVQFDWGSNAPTSDPMMDADHFSVRWRGTITTAASTSARFRVEHDDGVRLWIGGTLVLDKWNTYATDDTAVLSVPQNTEVPIKVEMRDVSGASRMKLLWDPAGGTNYVPVPSEALAPLQLTGGLLGEYFNGQAFDDFVGSRVDPEIDYTWGTYKPLQDATMANDFTARWRGTIHTGASSTVRFRVIHDDGARIIVDGVNVLEQWSGTGTHDTAPVTVTPDTDVPIEVDVRDSGGAAQLVLQWDPTGGTAFTTVPMDVLKPPPPPTVTEVGPPGVRGEYFNGKNFDTPVGTRDDAQVSFNWGSAAPLTGVAADAFSVRWTGTLTTGASSSIRLQLASDDGQRLILGGQTVFDSWDDSPHTSTSGPIAVQPNTAYPIEVHLRDKDGPSSIDLRWDPSGGVTYSTVPTASLNRPASPPTPGQGAGGLLGEYFNGGDFGTLVGSRIDAPLDIDFGSGAPIPVPTMAADDFSVRWTGTIKSQSSSALRFRVTHDDGVRLVFNGATVIDKWNTYATDDSAQLDVQPNTEYPIELQLRDVGGPSSVRLQWDPYGGTSFTTVPAGVLAPPAGGTAGLTGTYYNGPNHDTSVGSRIDSQVAFRWGSGVSPFPGVVDDDFSVRWTGGITTGAASTVKFRFVSDDGQRLVVGGDTVFDSWDASPHTSTSDPITVAPNTMLPIEVSVRDDGGVGSAMLLWDPAGGDDFVPVPATALSPVGPAPSGGGGAGTGVANPGAISLVSIAGSGNLGATPFNVDPFNPLRVDGSIASDGAISVGAGGVRFPSMTQSASGVTVTISITNESQGTGMLDPVSGATTFTTPLTIRIAGIPFAGGCTVGPFSVPFTTGTSGAQTGTPYNPVTGQVRLVASDVTVPNSSGCGLGTGSVDGAVAGTANFDLTFQVAPIVKAGSGNVVAAMTATPRSGDAPLSVDFDASASTVASGSIASYDWDFGDGATGIGSTGTHTYTTPGVYTASLTVTDSAGNAAQATKNIVVTGTYRNISVEFTGAASYTNAGPILTGSVAIPKSSTGVIRSVRGLTTIPGKNGGSATIGFNVNGFFGMPIFVGTIAVSDPSVAFAQSTTVFFSPIAPVGSSGAQGTHKWFRVTGPFQIAGYNLHWELTDITQGPVPLAPDAAFSASPDEGLAPEQVSVDASASVDPTTGGGIQSYEWDFGDGATATGVTATHTYTTGGTYLVTLTVINDAGLSSTTTRAVRIDALRPPSNFRLTGRGGGGVAWDWAYADFKWDPVNHADDFEVERVFIAGCILNGNRGPTSVGGGDVRTYRDSGEVFSNPSLCRGSQYRWHVRTVKDGARSEWSAWVEPGPL